MKKGIAYNNSPDMIKVTTSLRYMVQGKVQAKVVGVSEAGITTFSRLDLNATLLGYICHYRRSNYGRSF